MSWRVDLFILKAYTVFFGGGRLFLFVGFTEEIAQTKIIMWHKNHVERPVGIKKMTFRAAVSDILVVLLVNKWKTECIHLL